MIYYLGMILRYCYQIQEYRRRQMRVIPSLTMRTMATFSRLSDDIDKPKL